MFKNLYFAVNAFLFLVSCNKDINEDPQELFRVTKIISYPLKNESLADTNHLIYDSENRIERTAKYNESGLISYADFTWDNAALQQIQQFDLDSASNQFLPGYHAINFYDSTGHLTLKFQNAVLNDTFHFYYSASQLVKITSGEVTGFQYELNYLSGNVSSVVRHKLENGNNLFIDSIAYQYDGKTNPFYNPAFIFYDMPIHELVSWLSKNNLVGTYLYQQINGELTEKYSSFNILQYTPHNYPLVCLKFPGDSSMVFITSYSYDKVN